MELIKVMNARKVLDGLSDREDVGCRLSYWMTKFVVKTESEHTFYTTEMRKLFDKYTRRQDDNTMVIPSEKLSEFNAAVEALNKTDVEDPGIRFKLSDLARTLKLSMKQMCHLLDFIEEDQ